MQLPIVRWLRRLGITPPVPSSGARGSRPPRVWFGSLVKGYVFYAALYVELIYRYLASVLFRVRRGHWVVADRYITDLRYLYKERPITHFAAIRRLLCRWFPKPDLLIVLDNRADVIVSRKSGLRMDQIEVLRHFNLQAARDYRYEVITTNRPPDEIADHMLNRMLALRASKQAASAR
jgi:thymidylate kinase